MNRGLSPGASVASFYTGALIGTTQELGAFSPAALCLAPARMTWQAGLNCRPHPSLAHLRFLSRRKMSNVVSQATSMSTTAWWIAFAFTFTATVVFLALSYIRNVKPEARLVRCLRPPRVRPPRTRRETNAPHRSPRCTTGLDVVSFF